MLGWSIVIGGLSVMVLYLLWRKSKQGVLSLIMVEEEQRTRGSMSITLSIHCMYTPYMRSELAEPGKPVIHHIRAKDV